MRILGALLPERYGMALRFKLSLTTQILLGLIVGILIGYFAPSIGTSIGWIRDVFLHLIKLIIAPLVFATVVIGIAGGGHGSGVGRLGLRSLIYFEIVTTIALVVGLFVVNVVQPGSGIQLVGDPGTLGTIAENHPKTLIETVVHIFPTSVVDAMAKGDVLQIVAFSVLFGIAVSKIGDRAKPIIEFCESLAQTMFTFTSIIMRFAPFGIGAAMAVTVGHQGLDILEKLALLILALYLTLALFVFVVLGSVAVIARVPIRRFIDAVREPFVLAFVTTSSESALPMAMERMEKFGVPKRIVGFVMPAGYTFNLDGTTLYLAMASVFVMQAIASTVPGFTFGIGQQISMMLALMITSKGVAAVPRASLVVLLATLGSFLPDNLKHYGPVAVAMIFGVDEFMDMARTSVNLLGNCLATVVMARWEGEFDDAKALSYRSTSNE
jgi:proton glutamate symport protein